jgi:hypothetical protein
VEVANAPSHIRGMTARDRFTANLKCPQCGREGKARLSEEDGWSYLHGNRKTSVDALPDGFKEIDQPSAKGTSVDIFCATCNVSAYV